MQLPSCKMLKKVTRICSILLLLLVLSGAQDDVDSCYSNEKLLPVLDMAMEFYHYISNLFLKCENTSFTTTAESDKCVCGLKQKTETYIEVAMNLIQMAKQKHLSCDPSSVGSIHVPSKLSNILPVDCLDAFEMGQNINGVYKIQPKGLDRIIDVYCDMETEGGGWTVIQRRGNYTTQEKFFRTWKAYKRGFGNITKDFWLGNDNIHILSSQGDNAVRFEMEDVEGEKRHAQYDHFRVDDESAKYKLHIYGYSGDAGDSMDDHNQQLFSTIYSKNDNRDEGLTDCAISSESGYWFDACSMCNPNGVYEPGRKDDDFKFMFWHGWKKYECLKSFQIKIKRTDDL